MRLWTSGFLLLLAGCHRYADFTLPVLDGPSGQPVLHWNVNPEPVMTRGQMIDVLNPSVVQGPQSLLNLYSVYDGKSWQTESADSPDGTAWSNRRVVLSPDPRSWEGDYIAANGSAIRHHNRVLYWYQGGRVPRIGLLTSAENGQWRRRGDPVVPAGPSGSWDERGVADPYVIEAGEYLYMYYLGQDRARRQRLGVARSKDGVRWEKLRRNPILELGQPGAFDEVGLGEPAVWPQHGWYWMLYTGRDRKEFRRLGLARSRDGVRWDRVTEKPVLEGSRAWNSKVVCDPTVVVQGELARVWFGGGDKPEPAENLNGQIGYAELRIELQ